MIIIAPKSSKLIQARYTNEFQYNYVNNTIDNIKKRKEAELGRCTIGEALFWLCKEFNDGSLTYKVKTKYGDKKEKVIPFYLQKNWIDQLEGRLKTLTNGKGGLLQDTFLNEKLKEAFKEKGKIIDFSKEVEDRYEEYEYYIKKIKEEAEKFNGKIKKN